MVDVCPQSNSKNAMEPGITSGGGLAIRQPVGELKLES